MACVVITPPDWRFTRFLVNRRRAKLHSSLPAAFSHGRLFRRWQLITLKFLDLGRALFSLGTEFGSRRNRGALFSLHHRRIATGLSCGRMKSTGARDTMWTIRSKILLRS